MFGHSSNGESDTNGNFNHLAGNESTISHSRSTTTHHSNESIPATESTRLLDHNQHSIQNYDGGEEAAEGTPSRATAENASGGRPLHLRRVTALPMLTPEFASDSDEFVELDPNEQRQDRDEENVLPPEQDPPQAQPVTTQTNNQNAPQRRNQLETEEDVTRQVTTFTNRLRILFYTLYIPIVPLSAVLILLLMQLIFTAAQSPPCSQPLRAFALVSFILAIYIPNHKMIKNRLFHYSRDRDGANRPRNVRIYDQCFHMVCLSYLYMDMAIIQSCREDLIPDPSASVNAAAAAVNGMVQDDAMGTMSSCSATCPELYQWFEKFDLILRIFAAILILPLICLPFVYLWIVRRINSVDALFRLDPNNVGNRGREEEDYLAGNVMIKDIMASLREVVLVHEPETETIKVLDASSDFDPNGESERGEFKSWYKNGNVAKECCICMNDFHYENAATTCRTVPCDKGSKNDLSTGVPDINGNINTTNSCRIIVQTKCGHLFHKACIGGWIGGQNWEDASLQDNGRARRKNCPLCREDLADTSSD
jgi:hypothetical protein